MFYWASVHFSVQPNDGTRRSPGKYTIGRVVRLHVFHLVERDLLVLVRTDDGHEQRTLLNLLVGSAS